MGGVLMYRHLEQRVEIVYSSRKSENLIFVSDPQKYLKIEMGNKIMM